jgi:hypothetical protein
MAIRVAVSNDPAWALNEARSFLAAEPVLHNLILTLLHARIVHREPGRYWMAMEDSKVVGLLLQSPLNKAANLAVMGPGVIAAIVDAMADAGSVLSGVGGDASTAARFAGQWAERCKVAAIPFQGQRLYEVVDVPERRAVGGQLRNAVSENRDLIVDWVRRFNNEVGEHVRDPEVSVDRWLPAGQVWIWDAGEPVSMAVSRECVEGVVRLAGVFTPLGMRSRGYAEACVSDLSRQIRGNGHRCILYTDLGNPTSNSIYRRIGFHAVAEALRYRFE